MIPIGVITVKLIAGIIGLLIVTRLLGKKEMSQITPFDFAYSLILGEIIGQTVYDGKVSWIAVLYAIGLWGLIIYIIEVVAVKFEWIRKPLKGSPSFLIYKGQVNIKGLKKNNLEIEQLHNMLRQNGFFSIRDIEHAVFENDGSISIIPKSHVTRTTYLPYVVITEGKAKTDLLEFLGFSQEWLEEQLDKKSIKNVDEVLMADWTEEDGLFVITYEPIDVPDAII